MAASNRPRTLTPRALADDEYRIDQIRGRRYCGTHRDQQMIPLLPGVDVCPVCPSAGAGGGRQPESASAQAD